MSSIRCSKLAAARRNERQSDGFFWLKRLAKITDDFWRNLQKQTPSESGSARTEKAQKRSGNRRKASRSLFLMRSTVFKVCNDTWIS
uniref:Uncharacterized protein n=1 Tax=Ditylenchus dipsaci TaxID=166011 RepID=A0A915EVF5_9BILA